MFLLLPSPLLVPLRGLGGALCARFSLARGKRSGRRARRGGGGRSGGCGGGRRQLFGGIGVVVVRVFCSGGRRRRARRRLGSLQGWHIGRKAGLIDVSRRRKKESTRKLV